MEIFKPPSMRTGGAQLVVTSPATNIVTDEYADTLRVTLKNPMAHLPTCTGASPHLCGRRCDVGLSWSDKSAAHTMSDASW